MSKNNNQILEWLLYNNENWSEVHGATLYNNVKRDLKDKSEREVKNMFHSSGASWERSLVPVISGKVCYLENASFLEKKDIDNSRKELKRWISDEVISTENDGIVVNRIERKVYGDNIDGSEYSGNRVHFPEIEVSYYKKNTRKIGVSTLKSMDLTSCLFFKPSIFSADNVLFYKGGVLGHTKDGEDVEYDRRSLINEQGELRHKIKESQDLYLDMCFSHISGVNFTSFKNFPDVVHGNFVLLDWDNIISFEGFPKVCEKNVLMRNCRIPYRPHLPKNIEIFGDLICNDCTNDYNLIYAILKYDWNIHGKIYTSVYTGSLEKLRDIATTNGWI